MVPKKQNLPQFTVCGNNAAIFCIIGIQFHFRGGGAAVALRLLSSRYTLPNNGYFAAAFDTE